MDFIKRIFHKNNDPKKRGKFSSFRVRFANFSRFVMILGSYIVISVIVAIMLFARIQNIESLRVVEKGIATAVAPMQNVFDKAVSLIENQLRNIKLRNRLEKEYNKLLQENEKLVYDAMLANELKIQLSQYKNLFDEISANESLNPIACKVIGKESGNYFSVFTINKGSSSGITDFMAVTSNGALIGYTYNVSSNKSDVRTIIDGNASIAALIQSSRDQGTVRGTLSIDGKPLCRMYYLPDENLPRPGDEVVTSGVGLSFPRGIPIGYVRESTRGIEENKLYIVIEPKNDFRHIENVIVLRYKPDPIGITAKENGEDLTIYDPIPTAVPVPTIFIGKDPFSLDPSSSEEPTTTIGIEETPKPINTTLPTKAPSGDGGFSYVVPNATPTQEIQISVGPTPSPTPKPTPIKITIEE